jgi:hypothetical protein
VPAPAGSRQRMSPSCWRDPSCSRSAARSRGWGCLYKQQQAHRAHCISRHLDNPAACGVLAGFIFAAAKAQRGDAWYSLQCTPAAGAVGRYIIANAAVDTTVNGVWVGVALTAMLHQPHPGMTPVQHQQQVHMQTHICPVAWLVEQSKCYATQQVTGGRSLSA